MLRNLFRWDRIVPVAVLACAVAVWVPSPFLLERLKLSTFDLFERLDPRAPIPSDENPVRIVGFDEKSLRTYGQWPWPRTLHADIVDRLMALGARVVAFDILFADPDRSSSPGDSSNDRRFADAIRGRPVVLSLIAADTSSGAGGTDRPRLPKRVTLKDDAGRSWIPRWNGVVSPLPELEAAAAGLGSANSPLQGDGTTRSVMTVVEGAETVFPSLFVETLRVGLDFDRITVRTDGLGVRSVAIGDGLRFGTDPSGGVWPHFRRFDESEVLSVADVLKGSVPRAAVDGKFIFVGATAPALGDMKVLPTGQVVSGVVVHAQAAECALRGCLLVRPANAPGAELLLLVVPALILIVVVPGLHPWPSLGVAVLLGGGLASFSWFLFAARGMLIDVSWAVVTLAVVYGVLLFARSVSVRKPS